MKDEVEVVVAERVVLRTMLDGIVLTILDDEGTEWQFVDEEMQVALHQLPDSIRDGKLHAVDGVLIVVGEIVDVLNFFAHERDRTDQRLWAFVQFARDEGVALRTIAQEIGVTHQTIQNRLNQ